ncbi:MAG: mannose-1-phosphate guanylyltransferase/mannose-6-phosphate isomerase [Ferrovibrio sp.]|uniref:mannose-1-phosphate guanylyltransferase/mannose-6-phosphate isomerase n=1 Tax=Ferrovibrio sp. TaxID=1917215 RepID=UPI00391CC632
MTLVPVILCGGAGSRLWPISRELHPKPFIKMRDGESLLQKAFLRSISLPEVSTVLTVTNREFLFQTKDEYRAINHAGLATPFILEPFGRNTAAAIITAALQVSRNQGPDTILLVLPADHLINDMPAFGIAVETACRIAQQGRLVTFGIQPTHAETGYGYIEAEGNTVLRFVEKPSLGNAQAYLASGRHLWNSGMLCFTAAAFLEEAAHHCRDVLDRVTNCLDRSTIAIEGKGYQVELDSESFHAVPDISVDFAIMEKTDRAAVVPCDIGWNDIGSWTALADLTPPDADGNRIEGTAILHATKNCYIQSHNRIVGMTGVQDLIVIDTPDALLILSRNQAQDVKHIYNMLKTHEHEAYKLHRTVYRPWGTYTVLEEGNRFKIKRIEVKPGASLSLQMHHHRSEHWIVVSGTAKVVNGDQEFMIQANQSTYIPAGHKHRLENPGTSTLVMIEVQSGEYLGEDDIVRFQDAYGRA